MTGAPHCLCEQCQMTVQQCRGRATTSAGEVVAELLGAITECSFVFYVSSTGAQKTVVLLEDIEGIIKTRQQEQKK